MAGDTITIATEAWYQGTVVPPPSGANNLLNDLLNALTSGVISNSHGIYGGTDNNPNTILSGDLGQFFTNDENTNYTTAAPKAFLNYVAFDNQLNEVPANSGVVQVPTISGSEQAQPLVAPEQIIQKDGYLYIYVSNESAQKVFFDNLVIHHNRGPILQTDNYYPFGLTMAGISDQAALSLENNYLFNGKLLNHKEFSDNTGLEWYSYGMREYDPQIGRFFRVDPLASKFPYLTPYQYASNDPISNVDVDGLEGMKFFLSPLGIGEFALEKTLYKKNVANGYSPQKASNKVEVQSLEIHAGVMVAGAVAAYLVSEEGIVSAVRTVYGFFKGGQKLQSEESESTTKGELPKVEKPGGRSQNKLIPNKNATGDHTVFDMDNEGNVYKYETFERTKTGHDNPVKRFDGGTKDGKPGAPHRNKITGEDIQTPHVHDPNTPGGVRQPNLNEVPSNSRFRPYNSN